MQIATPFGTDEGHYKFMGRPALINCYSEIQTNGMKSRYVIVPCDGTIEFDQVTDSPCRGAIYLEDLDVAYTVHAQSIWKITSTPTATRVGTIPGIDRVQMERNQKATPQVTIYCAEGVFVLENDVITRVTDADLPAVIGITYVDGYNVYGVAGGKFYISGLNEATTIDGLDFAAAEQYPDNLVRPFTDRGELILFGQLSTEFWRNTGNADFPFEPISGTTARKGLLARHGPASADNSVFFPGHDGIVYRLNGYSPARISNHGVERSIEDEPSPSEMFAHTWAHGGHIFYSLTGTSFAWCYDASTGQWHQRESFGLPRWRASSVITAWHKVIFGDEISGNLYYIDRSTYTEAGEVMQFKIRTPTMHAFPNGGICDALHIDMLTGDGVISPTAQGYDPLLMLNWSDDGGSSFIGARQMKLAKSGNTSARVTARRTGRFGPKGRIWEMSITDPVGRGLALLDAEVRPLKR